MSQFYDAMEWIAQSRECDRCKGLFLNVTGLATLCQDCRKLPWPSEEKSDALLQ